MREVLDQLQKREQYLEKKAEAEMEIIKKNAGKNRRGKYEYITSENFIVNFSHQRVL